MLRSEKNYNMDLQLYLIIFMSIVTHLANTTTASCGAVVATLIRVSSQQGFSFGREMKTSNANAHCSTLTLV